VERGAAFNSISFEGIQKHAGFVPAVKRMRSTNVSVVRKGDCGSLC
jgi:hypothetical protein